MVPRGHRTRWNKMSTHPVCTRMQKQHPLLQGLSSAPALLPAGSGPSGTHLHLHPPLTTPLLHQGYSFVAPSILFDHNNAVMTDVLEASVAGDRPGRAALARSAMMQVGWARVGRSGLGGIWAWGLQMWLQQAHAVASVRSIASLNRGVAWPQGSR